MLPLGPTWRQHLDAVHGARGRWVATTDPSRGLTRNDWGFVAAQQLEAVGIAADEAARRALLAYDASLETVLDVLVLGSPADRRHG